MAESFRCRFQGRYGREVMAKPAIPAFTAGTEAESGSSERLRTNGLLRYGCGIYQLCHFIHRYGQESDLLLGGSVNSAGMVPNNRYNRYNFTFRNTTSFLNDKMKLDVSASYILQNDRNMTNQGQYSNSAGFRLSLPAGRRLFADKELRTLG